MNREHIARVIDHTLLRPEAIPAQVERLCAEALEKGFGAVCVNPVYVKLASARLADSQTAICTVVGFPLGALPTSAKVLLAQQAIRDGASEIDMVIQLGALKDGNHQGVQEDIAAMATTCHERGASLKAIIETALLSDEEKAIACRLAQAGGADSVMNATGFAGGGATAADVQLMRQAVGQAMGIKAAGGIRRYGDAMEMLEAGASRIGASAGVQIVEQAPL